MAKKRANGEGSISRFNDTLWWARITVNGKRKSFYGKTRAEVHAKMTAALNEANKGMYVETSKLTLGQWLDTWYNTYATTRIADTTRAAYEGYIVNHLTPAIGKIKLSDVRTDAIQEFCNSKLECGRVNGNGGLSPKTVKNILNMLHASLQQAVDNGLLHRNPCDAISAPKIPKVEMRVLTPDEHLNVVKHSHEENLGLVVRLGLATGMRIGELCGIMWNDINFSTKILSVNRTLKRVKNFDPNIKSKTVKKTGDTKTYASIRTIPLPSDMLQELQEVKSELDELRKLCGAEFNEENFVFVSPAGTSIEPRTMQDMFKRVVDSAGIAKATIHSLRHTFATRALEAGVQLKVVSEILGHSSVAVTADRYSHVLQATKRDAIEKISEYVSKLS